MPTIFGPEWEGLELGHVKAHLAEADDEPLLWEAKATKLTGRNVRRQVCAFANSHDGGYLILGARDNPDKEAPQRWLVEGVSFPDEPTTWITNVIADPVGGVRPRPLFDVRAWPVGAGHVAVVWVPPISTPPCIANGSVYERLPGESREVTDPLVLADLYRRGDEAHKSAEARAERAALTVLDAWLGGDAGAFRAVWQPPEGHEPDEVEQKEYVSFAVGIATTGNPPDISSRLFREDFAHGVWNDLRDRPNDLPLGLSGGSPDSIDVEQSAIIWRHEIEIVLRTITVVRAAWDGSVAVGRKRDTEDVYPNSLVEQGVASEWRYAEQLLVERLAAFGDVYVTVAVAGGKFPRRKHGARIVMKRGPLSPGVDEAHVASLARELMRALGHHAWES